MNGYSKISSSTGTGGHKSRSIDFSDFFSFPQTPKPTRNRNNNTTTTTTGPNINQAHKKQPDDDEPVNANHHHHHQQVKRRTTKAQNETGSAPFPPDESSEENGGGERFGVILGRSSSVSSGSGGILQATMKRAFSITRSSSVSERYCRIHDHGYIGDHDIVVDDDIDGDVIGGTRRSVNKKKKLVRGGKILRACKRILGF